MKNNVAKNTNIGTLNIKVNQYNIEKQNLGKN